MNRTILTLLAGVAIGVLLAPDKGSETWKKLRNRVNDLKDQATDKANDLASQGRSVIERGRNSFSEAME